MISIRNLIAALLLLLGNNAYAATISWDSANTNVNLNDVFTLNIVGTGFANIVDGGGVNFTYDQSVLNVLSVSIDESVWDFAVDTGTINNSTGSVDGIMVNTFSGVTGDFVVASIQMQAVGSGSSLLALSEFGLNPWASGGSAINPQFVDATVNVSAVPVPAAIWLFGSGLLVLFRLRKA